MDLPDSSDLPASLARFTTPAWVTAAGTAVAYGVVLLVLFLVLFVGPYLIFVAL